VIPIWLIPLIVQFGAKLIDYGFKKMDRIECPEKRAQVNEKIKHRTDRTRNES